MSEGDLQKAVDLFLDMGPGSGQSHQGTGSSQDYNSRLFQDDEVREAIPARYDQLIGGPTDRFPGMSEWLQGAMDRYEEEQVEHIDELSQSGNDPLYKPPDDLNTPGTFQDAMKKSKDSRKWLLVNIQSSDDFASLVLNRDIWSHETVKQIILSSFIFFQRDRSTTQGSNFCNNYKITSFPVICVVDPRTGRKIKQWSGDKFRGPLSATDLLSDFMGENPYGSSPAPSRASFDDSVSSCSPREMGIVVSEEPMMEISATEPILELPTDLPPPGSPDEVKVAIRLSNGQKKQVSFKTSHSLHVVQRWVSATEQLKPSKFEVRTSHPPKTLNISANSPETVESSGIRGSLLVVVVIEE
jgi:hypothetical protein